MSHYFVKFKDDSGEQKSHYLGRFESDDEGREQAHFFVEMTKIEVDTLYCTDGDLRCARSHYVLEDDEGLSKDLGFQLHAVEQSEALFKRCMLP